MNTLQHDQNPLPYTYRWEMSTLAKWLGDISHDSFLRLMLVVRSPFVLAMGSKIFNIT